MAITISAASVGRIVIFQGYAAVTYLPAKIYYRSINPS